MKHFKFQCKKCGKFIEQKYCYCTLYTEENRKAIESFFGGKGVEVKKILTAESSPIMWVFTSKGRFDIGGQVVGMDITNLTLLKSFSTFLKRKFRCGRVEISHRYIVKPNGRRKIFYGMDEAEIMQEVKDYLYKANNTEITKISK